MPNKHHEPKTGKFMTKDAVRGFKLPPVVVPPPVATAPKPAPAAPQVSPGARERR